MPSDAANHVRLLGKPVRVRLDQSSSKALKTHAKHLAEVTGRPVSTSAAPRHLLARGLKAGQLTAEDRAEFASGYREGFLAALSEARRRAQAVLADDGDGDAVPPAAANVSQVAAAGGGSQTSGPKPTERLRRTSSRERDA